MSEIDYDAFREETRTWLEANCPASMRTPAATDRSDNVMGGSKFVFKSEDQKLWLDRMAERGWTVPEWPSKYGGGGLDSKQAKILKKEMQRLNCRDPLIGHGIWMLGPALLEFGSEEQKQQHIPNIVNGSIRWCQGYSEPGSGSDLASLRCKAEDQGDHYLVNGQKCWTSDGDKADWMFCLVRTDDTGAKQQGISFVLFPMDTPGVAVRPVPLLTGESHFCDSFLENVVVPKANLVGEEGQGWTIAKALLVHERKMMSSMDDTMPAPPKSLLEYAIEYVGVDDNGRLQDADLRARVVDQMMNKAALDLTQARAFEEGMAGVLDMRMTSIFKLAGTENLKEKTELLVDVLGLSGTRWDADAYYDETQRAADWMNARGYTIAGGSSEVQLNLIAKRSLELPQE
ncbi:MAG: acyl-CoA dehydrogenase family protein [Pseudomonadales bacterium]